VQPSGGIHEREIVPLIEPGQSGGLLGFDQPADHPADLRIGSDHHEHFRERKLLDGKAALFSAPGKRSVDALGQGMLDVLPEMRRQLLRASIVSPAHPQELAEAVEIVLVGRDR
jgi:hypothetical protein